TGKNVYRLDLFLAGKGRTRIPVAVTASPYLVDNRPQGVIELFTDISNEKALDQAKDDFLALVSHQLQTPATAVKQFLGLLLEGYIGKIVQEQKDVVQKAYNNNEEQISIIQDLLEVARIESGKSVINVENIDIKAMIDEIVSAQQITVDKRQQHITIVVPAKLTAQADPTKLKMCIANLLSNALKYTSVKGTIQIKAYETESTVSIAIKDNGIGIAKDQMGKLFNRFSRIDQGGASAIPGTGIGLFLCKQIAEMHKGSMIVTSKPGEGSEFTVQLPKMHKKLKAEKS
ncbi:MAG: HAMP domain-containing sensor histidine kinase, partial [Candidatus Saccharimonadales bacterium]